MREGEVRAHGLAVEHQALVVLEREPVVIRDLCGGPEPRADRHRVPGGKPENRDERVQIAHVQRLGELRARRCAPNGDARPCYRSDDHPFHPV